MALTNDGTDVYTVLYGILNNVNRSDQHYIFLHSKLFPDYGTLSRGFPDSDFMFIRVTLESIGNFCNVYFVPVC